MAKKPLGRSSGSLNAPIAAFTMAVILCSYCIYSINSARREAQSSSSTSPSPSASMSGNALQREQRRAQQQHQQQGSWVQRALDEEEKARGR